MHIAETNKYNDEYSINYAMGYFRPAIVSHMLVDIIIRIITSVRKRGFK
jgi:hypothetical protein